jgi:hypothetical protein
MCSWLRSLQITSFLHFLSVPPTGCGKTFVNVVIPTQSGAKGRNLPLGTKDLRDSSSSAAPRNDRRGGFFSIPLPALRFRTPFARSVATFFIPHPPQRITSLASCQQQKCGACGRWIPASVATGNASFKNCRGFAGAGCGVPYPWVSSRSKRSADL